MTLRRVARSPEHGADTGSSPDRHTGTAAFGRKQAAAFHADPLDFLVSRFARERGTGPVDALWFAPSRLCVGEAGAARQVLGNRDADYEDTSDFFFTRTGVAGPRSAQLAISRRARILVQGYLDEHRSELPSLVQRVLIPQGGSGTSVWPDAGNRLMDEYLRPVLLCDERGSAAHALLDEVVDKAVLAGARERRSAFARMMLRRRFRRTLAALVTQRAGNPADPDRPRDLLDVVLAGGLDGPRSQVAEVYLSFLFALVGALGFALGWAVYLVGSNRGTERAEPADLIREALRLWPVAWLFLRTPVREHLLAGVPVGPDDRVSVCTYLVHRDPRYWPRPEQFDPHRWAGASGSPAFLPFGYGPHSCPGAAAATGLLEDMMGLITAEWSFTVAPQDGRPHIGPALAPARFALTLTRAPAAVPGEEVNP
jgi:hypothetical protein